jgi:ubiquinone/menaquinone biosynthesis C-methylase UbiE
MRRKPNDQYNLAKPDSMAVRVAARTRSRLFAMFMEEFSPSPTDDVLDLGVTTDQTYESSNYFEALYPYKNRITAAGIVDASFLQDLYPGVRFQFAGALNLPFDANAFDFVHSAAAITHTSAS